MEFKKTYKELNVLLPFITDIKVQQAQREQMAIMSFLAGLPSEFEIAKSQILSSSDITSLKDIFSQVLRTESTPSIQQTNVLVAKGEGRNDAKRWNNNNDAGKWSNNNDAGRWNSNKERDNDIICRYCKEPGHMKRNYKKLQIHNQRTQTANVAAASNSSSEKTITIPADEYAKLSQYHELVKGSTLVTSLAESGNKCLSSSSNKWVIDSGAADHMTDDGVSSDFPSAPAKPPIVQVYSRRQKTNDTCPAPTPSSSDPPPLNTSLESLDIPIALPKGKRQCQSIYSIANFISYDHLSPASSSLIASP
ncbi:hypothetical protein A4A49_44137, partial [Nicotiana attenuata]